MTEYISYEVADRAATITLRRPDKRNAITVAMMDGILSGVRRAGGDDSVFSIVLRGEGSAFTGGFDVSDPDSFAGGVDDPLRTRIREVREKAEWMRDLLLSPKPLIISVHGSCIGIGTYFALVSDFVIATDSAVFGLPEERLGSAGATWAYPFLIREIGFKRATEMVMTGRKYSASEFADLGLITRVVSDDDLESTTHSLCAAMATLPRDGIALNRAVKEMSLATIGHLSSFAFHPGMHPMAEQMRRGADEFDFPRVIGEAGVREAVKQRDEKFTGPWWGW